jgi:DnaK suppressor protein
LEFSRRDALNRRLQAVDAALERIDAGSYGVCTGCGTPIPEKRIAADPAVSLCISCQAASEAGLLLSTL